MKNILSISILLIFLGVILFGAITIGMANEISCLDDPDHPSPDESSCEQTNRN